MSRSLHHLGFESVRRQAKEAAGTGALEQSAALRRLDPSQRKALEFFRENTAITDEMIETLSGFRSWPHAIFFSAWIATGFIGYRRSAKRRGGIA